MAKICILSALLLQLVYTSQGQNSPCPDRFTYIKKPGSDETIGQIEIRDPPISNLEVHLKVDLKVATELPTSYIGVDLTKSREDAARDILEGRPLLYHIHFPVQNPLPTVHRIWLNHDEICSGPEISGNVTIITLEHIFKIIIQPPQNQSNPPPQNRPTEQKPPKPLQQAPRPTPQPVPRRVPRQASRSTPPAPIDKIENYNECGINKSHSGGPNLLIAHGNKTLPGQWPWLAAIFRVIYEYEYLCGGTILTTKHVLTGTLIKIKMFI